MMVLGRLEKARMERYRAMEFRIPFLFAAFYVVLFLLTESQIQKLVGSHLIAANFCFHLLLRLFHHVVIVAAKEPQCCRGSCSRQRCHGTWGCLDIHV
jgi:hypothetical protein